MAYSHPEWEDVVFAYLQDLHKRFRRPIPATVVAASLSKDVGTPVEISEVKEALESLGEKELIKRVGGGYIPLSLSEALNIQLGLEEVKPFTREYGEVPESHLDKVWIGDIRELQIPKAGGRYGLYPIAQFSARDKQWKGLVQED